MWKKGEGDEWVRKRGEGDGRVRKRGEGDGRVRKIRSEQDERVRKRFG